MSAEITIRQGHLTITYELSDYRELLLEAYVDYGRGADGDRFLVPLDDVLEGEWGHLAYFSPAVLPDLIRRVDAPLTAHQRMHLIAAAHRLAEEWATPAKEDAA